MANRPHITIQAWLQTLGLDDYSILFRRFAGVEDILHFTEADLKHLGVQNKAHLSCLATSLVMLKEKLEKKYGSLSPQTSPTGATRPAINIPIDYVQSNSRMSPTSPGSPLSKQTFQLETHPWYHGMVPRSVAEELTSVNGDFLVRDSTSSHGDYVLSCRWKNEPLHFVVNKRTTSTNIFTVKVKYHFEDQSFDTVPGLINYYVTCRRAITEQSGAIILRPIPRTKSVDYYEIKNPAIQNLIREQNPVYSFQNVKSSQRKLSDQSNTRSGSGSSNQLNVDVPHRRSSTSVLNGQSSSSSVMNVSVDYSPNVAEPRVEFEHHGSMPSIVAGGVIDETSVESSQSRQRNSSKQYFRVGSDPNLSALHKDTKLPESSLARANSGRGSESDLTKPAPPKPSRTPSIKVGAGDNAADGPRKPVVRIRNAALYEDNDRDYSDLDNVLATPTVMKEGKDRFVYSEGEQPHTSPLHRASVDSNSKSSGSTGSQLSTSYSGDTLPRRSNAFTIPPLDPPSDIDPANFVGAILPADNKALDANALVRLKMALQSRPAKVFAEHLTKYDLELMKVTGEHDLGLGVTSGLELITLPQGRQLRLDVLERCVCLKLVVAVSILTTRELTDRVQVLHQWIQVATELKSSLGNYVSFAAIMDGLQDIQIGRLSATWLHLKHLHGNSAFMFEVKLIPVYRSLNQGSWSLPLENVSIPHVRPLIDLLERDADEVMSLTPWEQSDPHCGVDIILAHLDTARIICEQSELYKVKANICMSKFSPDVDLTEMSSCAFQMRLLFGSRGAHAPPGERYQKFQQVVALLSERCEPRQTESSL
ncbi:breast cancer anti-estrogen resistance protein 3 homolog [Tubulanus polymorphus]|uniref:breast cancer anti-estrogen resistance protein 3 homolog n=1 Tax=Tubulanus polymorphus TaxID=672921 RepID=UPI003DA55FEA